MENRTSGDQNEHHFRRAVSLEPPMSPSEREATNINESSLHVNPLFNRPNNPMTEERNSSLRRHVSEPARNQNRIVTNMVTRAESIRSMVMRGTQQFFGISDENQKADQEIWHQRGRRLLRKHGKIKQNDERSRETIENNTGFDETDGVFRNNQINGFSDTRRQVPIDTTPEDLIRKPALKVTFRAIALASNTLKKKISNQNRQTVDKERTERHSQTEPIDGPIDDPIDSHQLSDDGEYEEEDEENFFVKEVETPETDELDAPTNVKWKIQRQVSVRGQTIPEKIYQMLRTIDNSNRRELGLGFIDRILNRKIKKNLSKEEREAIGDHIDDYRPYFTYWITTVQILIILISMITYSTAPYGFGFSQISGFVPVKSRSLQEVDYFEPENFWWGPRSADLIHLGAKYTPCMRRDDKIFDIIEEERHLEKNTGCCIRNDNSGCAQTLQDKCSPLLSTWHKWKSGPRTSGPVCGQDPAYCQQPASIEPYEWSDDITKWPICIKTSLETSAVPHMKCELLARPCCLGVYGQCHLFTREYCEFVRGFFHEEATLCSQVSCMGDVCGMISFWSKDTPDQFYRILAPIFLHAGLIHLIISVIFQYLIMRDIEKMIGWLRMAIIYIVSGIGGYLASAVFLPFRPEVGPAGSHYGVMACLFVEFINLWHIYEQPFKPLFKLIGVALFLLLLGFLPWIDNYAHFFGFIIGLLLSVALMPDVTIQMKAKQPQTPQQISERQHRINRKILQIVVCLTTVLSIIILLFVMLYKIPIYDITFFKYFNCIPITSDWCANQEIRIQRVDIL